MRALIIGLLCLALTAPAWAEKVEVDLNNLSVDAQRAVLAARGADAKMSWSGMGKEIGVAVNEALGAVVGNAEKFGTTQVGRFTMFLVFWKIMGKQIAEILIGGFIMVIVDSTILWSYRRTCLPRRMLIKKNPDKSKEWAVLAPAGSADAVWAARLIHAVLLVGVSLISFALMFA